MKASQDHVDAAAVFDSESVAEVGTNVEGEQQQQQQSNQIPLPTTELTEAATSKILLPRDQILAMTQQGSGRSNLSSLSVVRRSVGGDETTATAATASAGVDEHNNDAAESRHDQSHRQRRRDLETSSVSLSNRGSPMVAVARHVSESMGKKANSSTPPPSLHISSSPLLSTNIDKNGNPSKIAAPPNSSPRSPRRISSATATIDMTGTIKCDEPGFNQKYLKDGVEKGNTTTTRITTPRTIASCVSPGTIRTQKIVSTDVVQGTKTVLPDTKQQQDMPQPPPEATAATAVSLMPTAVNEELREKALLNYPGSPSSRRSTDSGDGPSSIPSTPDHRVRSRQRITSPGAVAVYGRTMDENSNDGIAHSSRFSIEVPMADDGVYSRLSTASTASISFNQHHRKSSLLMRQQLQQGTTVTAKALSQEELEEEIINNYLQRMTTSVSLPALPPYQPQSASFHVGATRMTGIATGECDAELSEIARASLVADAAAETISTMLSAELLSGGADSHAEQEMTDHDLTTSSGGGCIEGDNDNNDADALRPANALSFIRNVTVGGDGNAKRNPQPNEKLSLENSSSIRKGRQFLPCCVSLHDDHNGDSNSTKMLELVLWLVGALCCFTIMMTVITITVILPKLSQDDFSPDGSNIVDDDMVDAIPTLSPSALIGGSLSSLPPTLKLIKDRDFVKCRGDPDELNQGYGFSIDMVSCWSPAPFTPAAISMCVSVY